MGIWAISETHGNSRFTSRTSSNLERFHRLPRVCTKIMYGKLGGYRWQENLMIYLAPEGGCASLLIRHRRCRTVSYLRRCCYWKRYCSLQICFSPPARWGSLDFNTAPHHTELPASSAWSYYLSIFVFTQLWTKSAGCLANRRGTLRLVNIEKADQEKHPQWLDTPTLVTTCHHKSPRIPKVYR